MWKRSAICSRRRTSDSSSSRASVLSGALPRRMSIHPIREEIGVPSWWAVSRAMPTQIDRFSLLRIMVKPANPTRMNSPTTAISTYGSHLRRLTMLLSP
ncbi:hypothetical protein ES703_37845 [subsurface metagenome]